MNDRDTEIEREGVNSVKTTTKQLVKIKQWLSDDIKEIKLMLILSYNKSIMVMFWKYPIC